MKVLKKNQVGRRRKAIKNGEKWVHLPKSKVLPPIVYQSTTTDGAAGAGSVLFYF